MKNKSAQQLAKRSVEVQKKKHGKNYASEMKRRVQVRWDKKKVTPSSSPKGE